MKRPKVSVSLKHSRSSLLCPGHTPHLVKIFSLTNETLELNHQTFCHIRGCGPSGAGPPQKRVSVHTEVETEVVTRMQGKRDVSYKIKSRRQGRNMFEFVPLVLCHLKLKKQFADSALKTCWYIANLKPRFNAAKMIAKVS